MRPTLRPLLLATLLAALSGCAEGPPPEAPATPAGLVTEAQTVTSPAWREAQRALLLGAAQQSGRPVDPAQLEARLEADRNAALLRILGAMESTGGPEVIAYCAWLAENDVAPPPLRRAALAVLVRHVDRNDPAARTRAGQIWQRVAQLPVTGVISIDTAALRGVLWSNGSQALSTAQAGLQRCYELGLREDPRLRGAIRVTARIGANGAVQSCEESHEGLSPTLVACVVESIRRTPFAAPEGGSATVVVPVSFAPR
jgi:hypothetical protein